MNCFAEDESAFDRLYCVAFEMLDAQWLAMRASYMEFNVRYLYPMEFVVEAYSFRTRCVIHIIVFPSYV